MCADTGFWDWKIGDVATWAGAMMTFAAAAIALYSAREALLIAKMPLDADRQSKVVRARILATALGSEFLDAKQEIGDFADALDEVGKGQFKAAQRILTGGFLMATSTTQKALDHCEAFGPDDGALIADVCAEVLNLGARTSLIQNTLDEWEKIRGIQAYDHRVTTKLAARARFCIQRIDAGMEVLRKYGYTHGPERV
jgi:hypothetical protein